MSKTLVVDIDSDLRLEGTESEFTYRLTLDSEEYDRVSLLSITIPKSMYLVSATYGGNTFELIELGTPVTVTIPEGNYSFRSIVSVLQTQLNLMSIHGWTYTVAGNSSLGKLIFSVTGNTGNQPSIRFPISSSLFSVMGFNANSTTVFVGNTLTSPNVVMLTVSQILVKSDLAQSDWYSDTIGNVLGSFSLAGTPNFGAFTWSSPDPMMFSRALDNRRSGFSWFWLTDQYDNSIDLHGLPVTISIVFFKSDSSRELIEKDIKLRWVEKEMKADQ